MDVLRADETAERPVAMPLVTAVVAEPVKFDAAPTAVLVALETAPAAVETAPLVSSTAVDTPPLTAAQPRTRSACPGQAASGPALLQQRGLTGAGDAAKQVSPRAGLQGGQEEQGQDPRSRSQAAPRPLHASRASVRDLCPLRQLPRPGRLRRRALQRLYDAFSDEAGS